MYLKICAIPIINLSKYLVETFFKLYFSKAFQYQLSKSYI